MKSVFIVHGHDGTSLSDLDALLADLGVAPIVLREKPNNGKTAIEKFEQFATTADFAIVLITPDDDPNKSASAGRMRQNVVFEMGWFFSRLGRYGTLLLLKGDVELPSDIIGVQTKRYQRLPSERRRDIIDALDAGGIFIPREKRQSTEAKQAES